MTIFLIILCLTLCSAVIFQILYLTFLQRSRQEQTTRMRELERRCVLLEERLVKANVRLEIQKSVAAKIDDEEEADEWAEIIE